jgi:hypothetical protein
MPARTTASKLVWIIVLIAIIGILFFLPAIKDRIGPNHKSMVGSAPRSSPASLNSQPQASSNAQSAGSSVIELSAAAKKGAILAG